MTPAEYTYSNCATYNSEFILKDGRRLPGLIGNFFSETEPDIYYYVKTNNLNEFKRHEELRDTVNMRSLCEKIDLSEIQTCRRIYYS